MNAYELIFKKSIGKCEYCGNSSNLKPYGKNRAMICFDCGMKPENKDIMDQEMNKDIIKYLEQLPKKS